MVAVQDDLVVALAELYLDTDVRDALPRVAQRIAASGLPRPQLEQIWRRQITPAVHWNLKSGAGEWSGFDRHWLLSEVERRRSRVGFDAVPFVGPLLHRLRSFGAEPEFRMALWLGERLRSTPESARARRVVVWQALMQVYYSVDGEPPQSADASQPPSPSVRSADQLVRTHELEVAELADEFRAICDVLAELLSRSGLVTAAESQVAQWLDRRAQPKH